MNKIAAVATLIVLHSCTQSDLIDIEQAGSSHPIAFHAPLVNPTTRGIIEGTEYATTDPAFTVSAQFNPGTNAPWRDEAAAGNNEFAESRQASYKASSYWGFTHPLYWPASGYLTFQAFSPDGSGGVVGIDGVTWPHFTVENTTGNQHDLLFSDRVRDLQYNALAANPDEDNKVNIQFRHALAQVMFNAKTQAAYDGTTIGIKSIVLRNVVKEGAFSQHLTANVHANDAAHVATWTPADPATDPSALTDYATLSNEDDSHIAVLSNTKTQVTAGGVTSYLVIPQAFRDDTEVEINYTIQQHDGAVVPQVARFLLKGLKDSGGNDLPNEFEMGKKYVYNIEVGLLDICFLPSASDWNASDETTDIEVR